MKEIALTQGKIAIVDDEDFEILNKYNWHAHKNKSGLFYAIRRAKINEKWTHIKMHREIMNAAWYQLVDHKDGNTLNNMRLNLRIATKSQNAANRTTHIRTSSKFKGVSWHKYRERWQAYITQSYKTYYLGLYNNEEEAARVYDLKAKELFGEYAKLNFND